MNLGLLVMYYCITHGSVTRERQPFEVPSR